MSKLHKHLRARADIENAQAHRLNMVDTDAIDFRPCGELVLAEKVDMDRTAAGLHLPDFDNGFVRWRCTDKGPDVTRVQVGDEFMVGNTVEGAKNGGVMYEIPGRTLKTRLIHQSIIICTVHMPEPASGIVGADGIERQDSKPSLLEG